MNHALKLLTPFADVSGLFRLVALAEAGLLVLFWLFVPMQLVPTPIEIIKAWNSLALQDGLLVELYKSAVTIIKALILASLISFGLAFLSTAALFRPLSRWLTALRFLGFAGITFFFTLWTSSGAELKLWLLTFGMTAFLMTNALAMVEDIRSQEVDYARTLRLKGWRITWEVACMGRLADGLDLIRQNAAIGWMMLSMVEGLVRSEGGIGSLLLTQAKHLHLSSIFAIQITILAYGIVQDVALRYFRELLCPYVRKAL